MGVMEENAVKKLSGLNAFEGENFNIRIFVHEKRAVEG